MYVSYQTFPGLTFVLLGPSVLQISQTSLFTRIFVPGRSAKSRTGRRKGLFVCVGSDDVEGDTLRFFGVVPWGS